MSLSGESANLLAGGNSGEDGRDESSFGEHNERRLGLSWMDESLGVPGDMLYTSLEVRDLQPGTTSKGRDEGASDFPC